MSLNKSISRIVDRFLEAKGMYTQREAERLQLWGDIFELCKAERYRGQCDTLEQLGIEPKEWDLIKEGKMRIELKKQ